MREKMPWKSELVTHLPQRLQLSSDLLFFFFFPFPPFLLSFSLSNRTLFFFSLFISISLSLSHSSFLLFSISKCFSFPWNQKVEKTWDRERNLQVQVSLSLSLSYENFIPGTSCRLCVSLSLCFFPIPSLHLSLCVTLSIREENEGGKEAAFLQVPLFPLLPKKPELQVQRTQLTLSRTWFGSRKETMKERSTDPSTGRHNFSRGSLSHLHPSYNRKRERERESNS